MDGGEMSESQPKERSLFERLAESVGPMAKLPNNGANYHTGEQVVTHLNRVLGPLNWSFHVLDMGFEDDSDECWVLGQITAVIDGTTVVKQDYGSQAMKRARNTGKFLSKGEDRKAAATDALKRCARLLGAGLDAWANERAPSWRPDQEDDAPPKDTASTPARPTAPPTTAAAPATVTPEVHAAALVTGAPVERTQTTQEWWAELVAEAERVRLPTLRTVKAIDPKAAGEAQMKRHCERLAERLKELKGAA